ncbi:hypothetical protein N9094_00380 [bacterium]|jgi:hypothetical protein|nr:hypothetical protein [bacterium]
MKASQLRSLAAASFLITLAFLAGRFTAPAPSAEIAGRQGTEPTSSLIPGVQVQRSDEELGSSATADPGAEKGPLTASEEALEKISALLGGEALDHAALSEVLKSWVAHDPIEAMDYLVQGPRKAYLLRWVVKAWSDHSPKEASQWLAAHRDTEDYAYAIEGLTHSIQKDDPEGALQWAKVIEDPEVKTRVLSSAGYQQFRHNQESAYTALHESDLPPSGQEAIEQAWLTKWAATAKRNSQNLSSVAAAATAAGHTFDARDETSMVNQVRTGFVIEDKSSPFHGKFFGIPGLTQLEAEAAMYHLRLHDQVLSYSPEPE